MRFFQFYSSVVSCYLLFLQTTSCLRIPKDETRFKTKCYHNVSQSESDTQVVPAPKCIALNHPYCLDVRLPYNSTIVPDYVGELNLKSFEEISAYLERWRGAKRLPKCWPVLQMALCSILMPQCEEDYHTGRVARHYKPNVDICNDLVSKDECKFLARQLEDWPALFNCNDSNIYARNCTNDLRALKFSTSASQAQCQYPLVASSDQSTWFRDIGGCSIHCKFPLVSLNEQANVTAFVRILCLVGLFVTLAAIVLFSANKATSVSSRMAKVIKRCTWCQLAVYIGWSLQILVGAEAVACGASGSKLYGLPFVANTCVLSFLLTYLASMSSLFWCAHLGKLCHEKLTGKEDKSPGNAEIDRALSLFNYGIPLTLFVCVAFLGHIDGHGVHGICTVGQRSVVIKSLFVFAPTLAGTLYGNYFFVRIIAKLWFEKGVSMRPSLWRIFIRITALATLTMLQLVFEAANYFYEHLNESKWSESVDKFLACQLNLSNLEGPLYPASDPASCPLMSKPLVILDYLEILCKMGVGIVIASWAFYESNYRGLRRKLIDLLEDDTERQRRLKSISNQEASMLHGAKNGKMRHIGRDDLEDATYRDLIDMTSPTRCGTGNQCVDALNGHLHDDDGDDGDDDDDELSQTNGGEHIVGQCRRLSTETPSSLGSTALPSGLNSESSSMVHSGLPIGIRSKVRRSQRGKTSRDVLNDCKQLKQQLEQQKGTSLLPLEVPDQSAYLAAQWLLLNQLRMRFNPPNLDELQSNPVQQPQFHHGICTYAPNQDESNDSEVQAEESKT